MIQKLLNFLESLLRRPAYAPVGRPLQESNENVRRNGSPHNTK
jgi:hypothetical protein